MAQNMIGRPVFGSDLERTQVPVDELDDATAADEIAALTDELDQANTAYHGDDAPIFGRYFHPRHDNSE